jgi:hypothetical protein
MRDEVQMTASDRRQGRERRLVALPGHGEPQPHQPRPHGAAHPAPAGDLRNRTDRRQRCRRRSDARTIPDYASAIGGELPMRVISHQRLSAKVVALFECGCTATEVMGTEPQLHVVECRAHVAPKIVPRRRKSD